MQVFLSIAARNLAQSRRRTLLLAMALVAVTCLLVLLLSLSQGITDTMIRSATTLSSGHVNVAGFFKAKKTDAAPLVLDSKRVREIVKNNVEGLDFVVDRTRGWGRVVSETGSLNCGLNGIDFAEEGRFFETVRMAEESEYIEGGRPEVLGDPKGLLDDNTIMLFAAQAKRLGVTVGDVVTVAVETLTGARNTSDFTVVAVAKDVGFMSNWSVFASKASVRALYRLEDNVTGAVMVYLKDHTRSSEVMGQLQDVLSKEGYLLMDHDPRPFWMKFETVMGEDWTGEKLDLTIWSDEVSFLTWALTAVDSVSFILVGILMFIIAVGIMNSMWISVRERTTEVGTLRAIGMSRGRVLLMFMLEAIMLGAASTASGALLGAAIASALDAAEIEVPIQAVQAILMSETLQMSVRPIQLLGTVFVFTLIAAGSALWPALKASRMQPVTAIQHVG